MISFRFELNCIQTPYYPPFSQLSHHCFTFLCSFCNRNTKFPLKLKDVIYTQYFFNLMSIHIPSYPMIDEIWVRMMFKKMLCSNNIILKTHIVIQLITTSASQSETESAFRLYPSLLPFPSCPSRTSPCCVQAVLVTGNLQWKKKNLKRRNTGMIDFAALIRISDRIHPRNRT